MAKGKDRNFGHVIRDRRRRSGLTQQEVSSPNQNFDALRWPFGIRQTHPVGQGTKTSGSRPWTRSARVVHSRLPGRRGIATSEKEMPAGPMSNSEFC
jgi:hypothetical protein